MVADQPYDGRCDVWSLGVVAYEALCGAKPFDDNASEAQLFRAICEGKPRPALAEPV